MPTPTTMSTLILLEDDKTLRELMADGLRDDGWTVEIATSQAEVDAQLEACEGRAILVADRDIGSTDQNGFDIAAAALERLPALRVIYVSGLQLAIKHRPLTSRERALIKPFAFSQLLGAVKQLS